MRQSGKNPVPASAVPGKVVAVAVDADKGSHHALRWTADHLLNRNQFFYLVHVRRKTSSAPNSAVNRISLDDLDDDTAATFIEELDYRTKELLLPFQCFCSRRGLQFREVTLDDMDVPKAIIHFIAQHNVDLIVMGASSRNALLRTFKSADVPTSVSKLAPDFCSVYVISKGKISSVRPATRPNSHPVNKSISELPGSQYQSAKSEPDARHYNEQLPSSGHLSHYPKGDVHHTHSYYSTASCPSPSRTSTDHPTHYSSYGDQRYWSNSSGSSTQSPKAITFEERIASWSHQSVVDNSDEGQRTTASEMAERQRRRPKLLRDTSPDHQEPEACKRLMIPEECIPSSIRYRRYTIEEVQNATDDFSDALKIGEGGYGPVYKSTLDHSLVAIKILKSDVTQGMKQFQQEVEVLSCIRHPNMVLLMGACPEFGCLVYEFMANGSLDDRLFCRGNTPPLAWQQRFRIAAEIATGLLFLHQTKPEPLVHRDLKPGNILLDSNYVSKITDVGLARLIPQATPGSTSTQYHMTAAAGTFCYIDPEYQKTGMLGVKSDIYALGIILLQIITGMSPMGLAHSIEGAVEADRVGEMLDTKAGDWPLEETTRFAKLALKCAELRRRDRPDLGLVVLPELNRMRSLANSMMEPTWVHRFEAPQNPSSLHHIDEEDT